MKRSKSGITSSMSEEEGSQWIDAILLLCGYVDRVAYYDGRNVGSVNNNFIS